MRISTQMMQRSAVTSILDRQTDLNRTQQQLASGQRILSPSDDPTGTTQALALKQQLTQNDQYASNIDRLRSRLEAEENVLDSVGNTLMRVRELAEQGLNETYSQQNRASIAAEVWLLLDEVFSLANAKDGSGEYLFSGFQSETQPFEAVASGSYVFNGDQSQRRMQISPTREMQSSDSGSDIFENLEIVAGGKQNVFKTIYDLAMNLEANTPSSDAVTDIDTAMDSIFTTRAKIGARINAVDSQALVNEQFQVQTKAVLSSIEDLDYAEAIGRLNLEMAGLEAAQKIFQRVQNLSLFNSI